MGFSKILWISCKNRQRSQICTTMQLNKKESSKRSKTWCFKKIDVFFSNNYIFFKKTAECSKWICCTMRLNESDLPKRSKFGFFLEEKNRSVFRKKIIFLKNAEISKFAVKWDWKIQLSQNDQNLVSSIETYRFFEKNCFFFKEIVILAEML